MGLAQDLHNTTEFLSSYRCISPKIFEFSLIKPSFFSTVSTSRNGKINYNWIIGNKIYQKFCTLTLCNIL